MPLQKAFCRDYDRLKVAIDAVRIAMPAGGSLPSDPFEGRTLYWDMDENLGSSRFITYVGKMWEFIDENGNPQQAIGEMPSGEAVNYLGAAWRFVPRTPSGEGDIVDDSNIMDAALYPEWHRWWEMGALLLLVSEQCANWMEAATDALATGDNPSLAAAMVELRTAFQEVMRKWRQH